MSSLLLEIDAASAAGDRLLSEEIAGRLASLYEGVPSVSCECDTPGQCCELSEEEKAGDFATMYPLYLAEYLNIVDYIRRHLPAELRDEALSATDERPVQCPFLTAESRCAIHPVRPLACRTYGVLSRERVEVTAKEVRGDVPKEWIASFLFTERHTCCPHTRPLEPEKVADHAQRMIRFSYERDLVQMGREANPMNEERLAVFRETTRHDRVSRWSWGGFNTMLRAPLAWMRTHFADYWKDAILAE